MTEWSSKTLILINLLTSGEPVQQDEGCQATENQSGQERSVHLIQRVLRAGAGRGGQPPEHIHCHGAQGDQLQQARQGRWEMSSYFLSFLSIYPPG